MALNSTLGKRGRAQQQTGGPLRDPSAAGRFGEAQTNPPGQTRVARGSADARSRRGMVRIDSLRLIGHAASGGHADAGRRTHAGDPSVNRPRLLGDADHILRGGALVPLHDVELYHLTLAERPIAVSLNSGVVHKTVFRTVFRRDKAKSLVIIESLHRSFGTHTNFLCVTAVRDTESDAPHSTTLSAD